MATKTDASFKMNVAYQGTFLTVASPSGKKTVTVDLSKVQDDDLSPEEVALLNKLDERRKAKGNSFQATLLQSSLALLPAIKVKGEAKKAAPSVSSAQIARAEAEMKNRAAQAEKEQEEKAFLSDPDVQAAIKATVEKQTKMAPPPTPKVAPAAKRRTAKTVHNGVVKKTVGGLVSGGSLDAAEERIHQLEKVVKATERRYVLLSYDIPDVKGKECPNPSRLLWGHGFRLQLSVWFLPESELEDLEVAELLLHWDLNGIKVLVVPQDPSQAQLIKEIARDALSEEVIRLDTALKVNILAADDRLAKAMAEDDLTSAQMEKANKAHNTAVRAHLRGAAEDLGRAIRCSELFDETMAVADLFESFRATIRSLKGIVNAKAEADGLMLSGVNV